MRRVPRVAVGLLLFVGGFWLSSPSLRLTAAAAEALQYLLTLGVPGEAAATPGRFVAPQAAVYDAAGRLYVSDTEWYPDLLSDRIQVFGTDRQHLFDLQATDGTPLFYPLGMAIDATGKLLVADSMNDRLVLFAAVTPGSAVPPAQLAAVGRRGNYDPLDTFSPDRQSGRPPLSPLTLYFPSGVALKPGTRLLDATDIAGRVAVVDNSNHRIVVLDSMLAPLYDFGFHAENDLDSPPGSLEYPWDAAYDAAGRLYVADADNSRVQVFRETVSGTGRTAQFVRMFGSRRDAGGNFGSEPGDIARPYGIKIDAGGRAWIADPDRHRVYRIDVTRDVGTDTGLLACEHVGSVENQQRCTMGTSDGLTYETLLLGLRGFGGEALFSYPIGVAVSARGELAVADTDNHDVQLFSLPRIALAFDGGTPAAGTYPVGQSLSFAVTLKNDGVLPLTVTLAPSVSSGGEPFDATFGGAVTGTIAAGASMTFPLTMMPLQSGPFSIDVGATGEALSVAGGFVDAGTTPLGSGTAAAALGLSIRGSGSTLLGSVGDIFTVDVRLRNMGTTPLTNVLPIVNADGASIVEALDAPAAVSLQPLQFMAPLSFRYRLLAPGNVTFRLSATAQYVDPVDQTSRTLTVDGDPVPLTIAIDAKAPRTIAIFPPAAPSGWHNHPFDVRLEATDNEGGSGVASIFHIVAEANEPVTSAGPTASAHVGLEGASHLRFRATDAAGNVETEQSLMFRIDTIPPMMGSPIVSSALPPSNGWYRTDPRITFVAGDGAGGSGLASLTPAVTITTSGANQTAKGIAIDNAGNASPEAIATVNVDKDAPVLSCAPVRQPNASGWYTADIAISCVAMDTANPAGFSGLATVRASCAADNAQTGATAAMCTYSAQGTHTFVGEATDVAGNTTSVTLTIRLDKTPPVVTCGTVSAGQLWPPNHKMEPWDVSVLVADTMSGAGGFRLVSYSSSESSDARGDGRTSPDMAGWLPNVTVFAPTPGVTSGFVRSERSGLGTGRLYRLTYEALDLAGNVSQCTVALLQVPHDQRR